MIFMVHEAGRQQDSSYTTVQNILYQPDKNSVSASYFLQIKRELAGVEHFN